MRKSEGERSGSQGSSALGFVPWPLLLHLLLLLLLPLLRSRGYFVRRPAASFLDEDHALSALLSSFFLSFSFSLPSFLYLYHSLFLYMRVEFIVLNRSRTKRVKRRSFRGIARGCHRE